MSATGSDRYRAVRIAELARLLGERQSTLSRALATGAPGVPSPAYHDDLGRPYYHPEQVALWWPHRRKRGRPRAS